jgi:competence protein ComEC
MGILIAIVSGFASGVFLRSLFVFSWAPTVYVAILAGIFSGARLRRPRLACLLGAMFCLFVALGMLRAMVADAAPPDTFARDVKHRVSYEGIVVSDPDLRDANQRVEIRIKSGGSETVMLAVAPRNPTVAVGDTVYVSGTLQVPQAFADDGGRVFKYDKYLQRDGVRFILNFAYMRVEKEALWYSVPAALARIKHAFLNGLTATLPEPYASLAGGVVIGGKSGLGNELKDVFVRSGLVQIIVLSGYNVMIVAEWVMAALTLTKLKKRWAAVAGAIAIIVFVGIAGASATAVRAALMALIALYARATTRTYAASRALLFAVLLMLIWNPLYLVFDPGFGLSVAATAGLIWLASPTEGLLVAAKRRIFLRVTTLSAAFPSGKAERSQKDSSSSGFWVNATATTLAAQIAVLPLLLYDTGNLSLVSIPANLLTMPIVPLAMSLSALAGFAGVLFGSFAPLLGIVLAFPAYLANAYLLFIARESAALPFAAFTLPLFPFWLVLATYAALIFIASSKRFSTTVQLRLAKKASI